MNHKSHSKYHKLKIPIKIKQKIYQELGVVLIPKHNFENTKQKISYGHWVNSDMLLEVNRILSTKCYSFTTKNTILPVNHQQLELPLELKSLSDA